VKNSAKAPGVLDDSQHGAVGASGVPSPGAPFAMRAGEVDLAGHAPAAERGRVRLHHLGDELVAGRSGEPVVAALQLEIGIADAAGQQAQQCEPLRARWNGQGAGSDGAILQVNCEHALYNRTSCPRN